jgi:hypothetical protein
MSLLMLCAKSLGYYEEALGGENFGRDIVGHCFSHLNVNVDTRVKIGHICLGMGGRGWPFGLRG